MGKKNKGKHDALKWQTVERAINLVVDGENTKETLNTMDIWESTTTVRKMWNLSPMPSEEVSNEKWLG